MNNDSLVVYYAPRTRAMTALWLLEELGLEYQLESFDVHSGRQRQPDYLALNPMGKVPLVVDQGVPVAELDAIAIYLCDRFPKAGLAPAFDDPDRAAYLRWIFFASAIIEPCFAEVLFGWDLPSGSVAWGSFERMMAALHTGLAGGPFLLGDAFSAADLVVGAALRFGLMFGAITDAPEVEAYVQRCHARPAFERATQIEARESERFPPQAQ